MNEEDWAAFERRWQLFKTGTDLHASRITAHLIACCDQDLECSLFRNDPHIASKSADDVLASIKSLAVVGVALSARRAALMLTNQDPGETVCCQTSW